MQDVIKNPSDIEMVHALKKTMDMMVDEQDAFGASWEVRLPEGEGELSHQIHFSATPMNQLLEGNQQLIRLDGDENEFKTKVLEMSRGIMSVLIVEETISHFMTLTRQEPMYATNSKAALMANQDYVCWFTVDEDLLPLN